MNVASKDWQPSAGSIYRSRDPKENSKPGQSTSRYSRTEDKNDILGSSAADLADLDRLNSAKDSKGGFKMNTSGPKNTVGELAAMLSNAETLMDVQQVMSKAMRALAELKMAAIGSEGKEAKKYAQQIKRMEKLIKRIQKKIKHLSKEQRLEDQRRKALKKAEMEKAKQIAEELKARRKKRRRDEKHYALKELAEDGRSDSGDLMSAMADALTGGITTPDLGGLTGSAAGYGSMTVDSAVAEGMSVDISI